MNFQAGPKSTGVRGPDAIKEDIAFRYSPRGLSCVYTRNSRSLFVIQIFRWVGRLEGVSFLVLLLIAMPLKYIWGHPEATRIAGMIHGILFLSYCLSANYAAQELNWPRKVWLLSFVAAVLPLGTFVFEKKHLPHA